MVAQAPLVLDREVAVAIEHGGREEPGGATHGGLRLHPVEDLDTAGAAARRTRLEDEPVHSVERTREVIGERLHVAGEVTAGRRLLKQIPPPRRNETDHIPRDPRPHLQLRADGSAIDVRLEGLDQVEADDAAVTAAGLQLQAPADDQHGPGEIPPRMAHGQGRWPGGRPCSGSCPRASAGSCESGPRAGAGSARRSKRGSWVRASSKASRS